MATMTSSSGIQVNVPMYPKLKTLAEEADGLRKTVRDLETRMSAIDLERQRGDMATLPFTERREWEGRRAKLKAEYESAEIAFAAGKTQLERAEHDYREWIGNFATWLYKIKGLQREFVNAPEGGQATMIMGGEAPLRAKEEIENDLLATLQNLANFSGDASVAAEARELEKQIADSKPYVTLTQNYVRLGNGEVVSEAEFQARAVEFGDSVSKNARAEFNRGLRVPREKARELNLT